MGRMDFVRSAGSKAVSKVRDRAQGTKRSFRRRDLIRQLGEITYQAAHTGRPNEPETARLVSEIEALDAPSEDPSED